MREFQRDAIPRKKSQDLFISPALMEVGAVNDNPIHDKLDRVVVVNITHTEIEINLGL